MVGVAVDIVNQARASQPGNMYAIELLDWVTYRTKTSSVIGTIPHAGILDLVKATRQGGGPAFSVHGFLAMDTCNSHLMQAIPVTSLTPQTRPSNGTSK